MVEPTVIVYSGPGCGACRAKCRALESRGIAYRVVDVTESAAALEYVTQELGSSQAPVVVVDDNDHWSEFRPDKIVAHTP